MGTTSDLITAIATQTADAGIGVYNRQFASDDTAITDTGRLARSCDKAISLADYTADDPYPDQPLTVVRMQVQFRGLPNDRTSCTDLRDAFHDYWQARSYLPAGEAVIDYISRYNSLPITPDELDRYVAIDNYEIVLATPPTAHRT